MTIPLVIAVVGVAGTLAGVLVGGWQGRRHEHRRWLRDKRLDAYSAFGAAVNEWQRTYNLRGSSADLETIIELTRDVLDRYQVVALLAGEKTRQQAQELVGAVVGGQAAEPDVMQTARASFEVEGMWRRLSDLLRRDLQDPS